MRISDWSSDVCSSDLDALTVVHRHRSVPEEALSALIMLGFNRAQAEKVLASVLQGNPDLTEERSEEHTSELQSLMHISYAVFCLKKKIQTHRSYDSDTTHTK